MPLVGVVRARGARELLRGVALVCEAERVDLQRPDRGAADAAPFRFADAGGSAQAQNLGRALGVGTAAAQLIAPGTMYGDRVTQVDVRFGKSFRVQRSRIQASVDLFNVLNSSAILGLNTTYGTSWLSPTQILQGRLIKIGAQVDF